MDVFAPPRHPLLSSARYARTARDGFAQFLRFLEKWRGAEILRVSRDLSVATRKIKLFSGSKWIRAKTRIFLGEIQQPRRSDRTLEAYSGGPICAGLFLRARITEEARFPLVIAGGHLVLPSATNEGALVLDQTIGLRPGAISAISESLVIRQRTVQRLKLSTAIYAGFVYPGNWSHWLLNFLPAVFAATRLPAEFLHFPLLLPKYSRPQSSTFDESLSATWGNRPTQIMPRGEVKVGRLVYIDSPFPHGPFAKAQLPSAELTVHSESMSDFREHILRWNAQTEDFPSRIYLRRANQKHNTLHPRTESRLISMLERYGFATIEIEKLGFQSQVSLIRQADAIVGIDGSAFANLLFCEEGTKILSIFPSLGGKKRLEVTVDHEFGVLGSRDFYGNIAALAQADLKTLIQPTVRGSDGRTFVHLDVEHLESIIKRFFGPRLRADG